MTRQSRRSVLKGGALLAGTILIPAARSAEPVLARLGSYPFTLGVASGEPAPDGFVIWTRLAPHLLEPDGGMPPLPFEVDWQVAGDPGFAKVVRSGQALAVPEWGHSVHVDVTGLRPSRPYWYRFRAGGEISPAGRSRTTPPPGAAVDRLRACFASCQKYEAGYYAAYRHMVADDPDLVLFLGDYIYEGVPGSRDNVRLHLNP
ncbi:MAG: PhoD-like phosphatase N-terminal domain-containing protein, partial [Thiohalobacteraceae bacterium]